MRKKIYFDKRFGVKKSMYILIDNGKIREFEGADFLPLILNGHPQPEYKTFKTNDEFKLEKVSKYDRKSLKIDGNYKVVCNYLFTKYLSESYIKLNWIEKFMIDYSKKESIFHQVKFARKLLIAFSLTIPIAFLLTQFKSCNGNTNNLKNNNQVTNTKKGDITDLTQSNYLMPLPSIDNKEDVENLLISHTFDFDLYHLSQKIINENMLTIGSPTSLVVKNNGEVLFQKSGGYSEPEK
jgi:hypothetical protein